MSLRYALLGTLLREPASGNALARHFSSGTSCLWQASFDRVQGELRHMRLEGLIETLPQDYDSHRYRRFRVTYKGESELARWLDTPGSAWENHNNPLQVRTAFMGHADHISAARHFFKEHIAAQTERAAVLRDILGALDQGKPQDDIDTAPWGPRPPSLPAPFRAALLRLAYVHQLEQAQAEMAMAEAALALLAADPDSIGSTQDEQPPLRLLPPAVQETGTARPAEG
jgi:DNA-binding PadR family transcriptional regulator